MSQVFRETVEAMFDELRIEHIIVFIVSLVWAVVIWLAVVRPMMRRVRKETRQVAEMLSQLPAEMDVESLVAQALVKTSGMFQYERLSMCSAKMRHHASHARQ